jgi:L-aspartate semialdehyde sulfurtransferase ferredoxin
MAKAPTAKKTKAKPEPTTGASPRRQRLWLMYPPKLIKEPLIWKLGHKFNVITNLRQASVTDEIGVVCLELEGRRDDVQGAIDWLEKTGVNVEPVEMSAIAG